MAVINNTFTEIGDAAIVKAQVQATGIIFFSSFSDITIGEALDRFFKKEVRYSFDNTNFSEWFEIDSNIVGREIDVLSGFLFLEYRYTRSGSSTLGALIWSGTTLEVINNRSFLTKINSITSELYPTGWAWKNKLNETELVSIEVENNYLISLKTIADSLANFQVVYTGVPLPLWSTTNQQKIGDNVDFIFFNDDVKEIFVYADNIDDLDGSLLVSNDLVFELDLSRSKSDTNLIFPFDNKLRRLKGPISTLINEIDFTYTQIEVLDFTKTIFKDSKILLAKVNNLYFFTQPESAWSVTNFKLTDSTIYNTLDLSKMSIVGGGGVAIVDNWFLEEILFNKFADYSNFKSIIIENSTLLKYVDFSFMAGALTLVDSSLKVRDIGATQADVDKMLNDVKGIAVDSGQSNRVFDLSGNATPSAQGLLDKAYIESLGINVLTE